MRVLFCISHAGFARNFESVLRELDRRGHAVTVLLDRAEAPGPVAAPASLAALAGELRALTVRDSPPRSPAGWTEVGRHLRAALDYLRFLEPAYEVAEKPRARSARQVPRLFVWLARGPRGRRLFRRVLRAADHAVPVDAALREALRAPAPDVLCLTPLIDLGSPQLAWVRAARAAGTPSILCVASWDNLTMRGGIHEAPDRVCVWNEGQRREAVELHGVPPDRVVVTGATAYDHWFAWEPGDRRELLRRAGLDPEAPYLLYVGSSPFITPGEGSFVGEWLRAIRRHPALEGIQVLVRPHPLNAPAAQERQALEALGGVAVHPPSGANPTDDETRREYFDSLHHAAAVVGINTSAFVEAAIAGRPVHTMLAEQWRPTQRGTLHFAHLLPAAGGPLVVGRGFDEHAAQLVSSLRGGDGASHGRAPSFVHAFVRPRGLNRQVAGVLVDVVEEVAAEPPAPARPGRPLAGLAVAHAARLALRVLHYHRAP